MEIAQVKIASDYELERGKPRPDLNHSIIQGNLLVNLHLQSKGKYRILPEINIEMPVRDRVPDLALYPPIPFRPDDNEIRLKQPPLCAIEILSEMQSLSEFLKKRNDYFSLGVQSYWLVIPALQNIRVYESVNNCTTYTVTDRLVDKNLGIELDLSEIFQ